MLRLTARNKNFSTNFKYTIILDKLKMVKSNISERIMELELKKSDIRREKARIVLDKSVWLYFLFMVIGALGFVFGYINPKMLNLLIVAAFIILIIGSLPYITIVSKEEKKIDSFIERLRK